MGQFGHHFAHRAEPRHVGQLGLVPLHLLLGAAALLHLHAQAAVHLGQLGRALLDAMLQLVVGLPQLFFGPAQAIGLPHPLQRLIDDRRQQLHERGALDEIVVGAAFHHLDGHALAAVTRWPPRTARVIPRASICSRSCSPRMSGKL